MKVSAQPFALAAKRFRFVGEAAAVIALQQAAFTTFSATLSANLPLLYSYLLVLHVSNK